MRVRGPEGVGSLRLLLIGGGVGLAVLALAQYAAGSYGPAALVGVGSIVSSLFGATVPSNQS